MRKRVYLFELDSVRNTDEEVRVALQTIHDEIVINGNVIVMTYNQLVDSRVFFSLFSDERWREDLLALFENGALRISQYGDARTVTQYLLQTLAPQKQFIYSALPLKYSQRRLAAMIRRSLTYSDLSEIHDYLDQKTNARTDEELRALFAEAVENPEPAGNRIVQSELSPEEMRRTLGNLYWLLTVVQQVSMLHEAYIAPREPAEYAHLKLSDYLDTVLGLDSALLQTALNRLETSCESISSVVANGLFEAACNVLRDLSLQSGLQGEDNRSAWLRALSSTARNETAMENVDAAHGLDVYRCAEAIVNLCYNYACESSIADISRHYDVQGFLRGEYESFAMDFLRRLEQDWTAPEREKRYLKDETNIFRAFERAADLPSLGLAVRLTEYVDYQETTAIPASIAEYESQLPAQRNQQRHELRRRIIKRLAGTLWLLIPALLIAIAMNALQDFANSFTTGIVGAAILLVAIVATEELTELLSNSFNIPALSDTLGKTWQYLSDLFHVGKRECAAYQNGTEGGIPEPASSKRQIGLVVPTPLKRYKKLREERAELFRSPTRGAYPLAPLDDDAGLAQVIQTEEDFGGAYGVAYESQFNLLAVDPVLDERGNVYAYERIIPAVRDAGVVMLTICEDCFVLLWQFRHAIREWQYAIPRGFLNTGEEPRDGARRELSEELGEIRVESMQLLGRICADSGLSAGMPLVYEMKIANNPSLGNTGHEGISECLCVSEGQLRKMIGLGEITDGFTLAAYALYRAAHGCDQQAR